MSTGQDGIEAPEMLPDGSWHMWALTDGEGFSNPGHWRFVQAHAQPGDDLVQVRVSEDAEGPYYGWLAAGHDIPSMIYGHPGAFRMCFPYGPDAEERRGKGRAVRLVIEAM